MWHAWGRRKMFLGKPEKEGLLRRATRSWKDVIKIELTGIGCKSVKMIWPRVEKAAG
jgi:hypothetical protein